MLSPLALWYGEIGTNKTISPLTGKTHCEWWQFKLVLGDLQRAGTCLISKIFNPFTSLILIPATVPYRLSYLDNRNIAGTM